MRFIPVTEACATAASTARMFPEARWSYLRSALRAATILTVADENYFSQMDNRAYHTRIRNINVAHYLAAIAR